MKEAAGVLLAVALLVGATWLSTEQLHDRELMVSPPDAVAEGFVRAVMEKRFEPAGSYMKEEADLEPLYERLHARLGEASAIDAELVSRTDEEALVNVRLESAQATEVLALPLVWENGAWKVTSAGT